MRLIFIFFFLTPLALKPTFADEYLQPSRDDQNVPLHCQDYKVSSFGSVSRVLFYGISGASLHGFTHEIPISRDEANRLWTLIRQNIPPSPQETRLTYFWNLLHENAPQMGFNFSKEGDVLEALALIFLQQEYPSTEYFLSGGVTYAQSHGGALLGELDILVARKKDCAVIAVGESKLGIKQIGHARKQIQRFHDFLKRKLCQTSESEDFPVCQSNSNKSPSRAVK